MTTDNLPPLLPLRNQNVDDWCRANIRAAIAAQNVRIEELEDELGRAKRKPE